MKTYSVMLINAPTPGDSNSSGNYAAFPAMGVVSLGTRLQKEFSDIGVYVEDGGIKTADEIKKRIDRVKPSLVGLSVLTTTYREGLKLAEYAKNEYGSTVVLGDDHASFFPELILQNRSFVDYVAKAEGGEVPLSYIIERELGRNWGLPINDDGEERVYFRTPSGIRSKGFPKFLVSQIYKEPEDIPNLSLIEEELEATRKSYNNKYRKFHRRDKRPVVVNNVRGCANGSLKKRCSYCSIYDLRSNIGNAQFFWDTVKKYNGEHGIDFFFEVCDSFLSFAPYVRRLVDSMPFDPKSREIEFEVYARVNDVANLDDGIDLLKRLNVTRVDLGLDSGDDHMLEYIRKNNKDRRGVLSQAEINYEGVKRLVQAGITVHASFPLGCLGETHQSLDNTVRFIERLAKEFPDHMATLEASELMPLPHSPVWDLILSADKPMFDFEVDGGLEGLLEKANVMVGNDKKEELRSKYASVDLLDTNSLIQDWVENFTHVDLEDIERAKRRVAQIAESISAVYGRAI